MNPGLLQGFAQRPLRQRKVVGLLQSPLRSSAINSATALYARCVIVQSGSVTAGINKEFLNIRGAGTLLWLQIEAAAGSRDVTTSLSLDGAELVNHTALAMNTSQGILYIGGGGQPAGSGLSVCYQPIDFSNSLVLSGLSSASETNGFSYSYAIELKE